MAQYQKNFYASSLYGRIKAFYGEYLTEIFDAEEPFTSQVNAKIEAQLPSSFYPATSLEFKPVTASDWTVRGTDLVSTKANSPVEFYATGDYVEVHVRLQSKGQQTIQAQLFKEEEYNGAYSWVSKQTLTIDTLSVTEPNAVKKIKFNSHGFGDYKVVVQAMKTTAEAILVGATLCTSEFSLEIRASADKNTWSNWESVTLDKQLQQDSNYLATGESSTTYTNVRFVQGKIIMLSSDNQTSPIIDRVELRSEDSGLYDPDGTLLVQIDMDQVATAAGKSFQYAKKIKWTQQQPTGTSIDIRSSSSLDNIFWGPITAPYRKDTNRLRLKRGITSHSVTLGPINEGSKFDSSKTASLLNWDTQAFAPKDASNTKISYVFSKTRTNQKDPRNLLQSIDNPMDVTNRAIQFTPQPYFLTVEINRSALRGTPVVDIVDIYQNIKYSEVVNVVDKDVSLVDGEGTGVKSLQKISDYPFKYPSGTNQIPFNAQQIESAPQTYSLEDKTSRPSDVMLYFLSEKDKGTRTNVSDSASDEILTKVIQRRLEMGDTTGVVMHYQYGAGKVQYLRPYERELDSTFTPFLLDDKKYRYYIQNGWPSEIHTVVDGQTLEDVANMYSITSGEIEFINDDILTNEDGTLLRGQQITIPNHTFNLNVSLLFSSNSPYTQKSSHNAMYDQSKGSTVTDFSSETILVSVPVEPERGYVDWVSEEKIYTGIINVNDIRDEFIRTQFNRSTHSDFNREHVVQNGDSWESIATNYDVHVDDLKLANDRVDLEVGTTIIVPPNIILPELAPEAEFENENPYEISIIPDSVHKKNGQRIDESFIPIDWSGKHLPMEVTYRNSEILTAEMVRGTDRNGMDPLPLSDVIEIVSVKAKTGSVTYHQWDDALGTGDFKLTNNYVDWSPTGAGVLEPEAGKEYIVTYIRKEVDTIAIHLDTTYFEKTGTDLVWRSPEVKVFDGVCTPTEDFKIELPAPESFEGYDEIYKNVGFIIEDNDLWVETKIEETDGKKYLIGTLNGKDPSKNWHPTINTGYYYLKEQENYLYSEPIKTVLDEKELPTAQNIEYVNGAEGIGALLLPSSENMVKDSVFGTTNWKKAKHFSIDSVPTAPTTISI